MSRQKVLDLARLAVREAAKDGGVIAATAEADRLLAEYPDCDMSLDELQAEIAKLAVEQRIVVEFGKRPND